MLRGILFSFAVIVALVMGAGIALLLPPLSSNKGTEVSKTQSPKPNSANISAHSKQQAVQGAVQGQGVQKAALKIEAQKNTTNKPQSNQEIQNKYELSAKPQGTLQTWNIPIQRPTLPMSPVSPQSYTQLVSYTSSPFPYEGPIPHNGKPFLNVEHEGQMAHKTPSGRIYFANQTYNDNRTLIHIPKGFNIQQPGVIVLFFHGHGATLERDVQARQEVPAQITNSGVNAILVAPQFAVNAKDSSSGKFWQVGGASRFLDETAEKLEEIYGKPGLRKTFNKMPVVIVAYSGGYAPTAWVLAKGGINHRLKGVALLDGLYGHVNRFASWIKRNRSSVFLSAHTNLTSKRNVVLQDKLKQKKIAYQTSLEGDLTPGSVTFIKSDEKHHDFVNKAWVHHPIQDLLVRLNGAIPGIRKTQSASF